MSVPPYAEDCCVLTLTQQKVVALLSAGATIAAAARAAGVHRNTVRNWRRNPAIQAALTQDSQAKANLWLGETDPVVLLKAALALLELQGQAPLAVPEKAIRETSNSVDAPCRPATKPGEIVQSAHNAAQPNPQATEIRQTKPVAPIRAIVQPAHNAAHGLATSHAAHETNPIRGPATPSLPGPLGPPRLPPFHTAPRSAATTPAPVAAAKSSSGAASHDFPQID
jgi:transposase-like protein